MQTHRKCWGLLAGLALGASAHATAEQWFIVAGPSAAAEATLVEIDLETVRAHGSSGEGVIRVTHDVSQPHPAGFGYRSFIATAQFDCVRRTITLASSAYFALPAAQGTRLAADSSGRQAGMPPKLLDSIPAAARSALLKATCAAAQAN